MHPEAEGNGWIDRAACSGSAWFVSVVGETAAERDARESAAKRVCAGCSVRDECLEYALRVREALGIWGGLDPAERRQLVRAFE